MKQQSALIAIPEEWILLLSGGQRIVTRLSIDLHVARRLALRRITRIRAGRWRGRGGACVGDCGKPKAAPPMMPAAATGAATKRMRLRDMVAFILSFPLRVGVWFCPHRCRSRTFVRELVTAPKLRIRPLPRRGCVSATRVTGDLRLSAHFGHPRYRYATMMYGGSVFECRVLGEQSSIPVDQDLLRGLLRGRFVVGAFDEFAVLESCAGTNQCHQVGRVDGAPA